MSVSGRVQWRNGWCWLKLTAPYEVYRSIHMHARYTAFASYLQLLSTCCQTSTPRLKKIHARIEGTDQGRTPPTSLGMAQMNLTVPHHQQGPALSRLRAAKDLSASRDRPFAALRVTGILRKLTLT